MKHIAVYLQSVSFMKTVFNTSDSFHFSEYMCKKQLPCCNAVDWETEGHLVSEKLATAIHRDFL